MCYADDTQLYFHLKPSNMPVEKLLVENCISCVHQWLAENRLCLNSDKTERMWCASSRRTRLSNYLSLLVGESVIDPSISVRNLGIQLRSDLMINDQISTVVRSCNYNIRQLRAIRSSLSRDALRDVAHALALSRLIIATYFMQVLQQNR